MKKEELMKLVGKNVMVEFYNSKIEKGILKYVDEFSRKYGYRKPDYFYINDISFKTSHIKKMKEIR